MKKNLLYFISIASIANFLSFTESHANTALVIGVNNYKESPLANPLNDVDAISKSLRYKGWKVTELRNPSSDRLKQELRNFFSNGSNDKPAIVYFSGHGLQYKGENYLLPSDINSSSPMILRSALSVTELSYFSRGHSGPKIFIIDACRNSPLGRNTISVSSGLNSQFAPPNSVIAYATAPGEFALDGPPGGNSPYAHSLSNAITRSDSIESAFKVARVETLRRTSGKQIPWESSSLISIVSLSVATAQLAPTPSPAVPQTTNSLNTQFPTAAPAQVLTGTTASQATIQPTQTQTAEKLPHNTETSTPPLTGLQFSSNSTSGSLVMANDFSESFSEAYDELARLIKAAPLSSFGRWDGKPPTERDRSDFLLTVQIYKNRVVNKVPRGLAFALIDTFQRGVMYPLCQKGEGVNSDCGDSGRWLRFQPNLALSLKLSKIAMERGISSDRLALHYQNGWIVEKDLLKAYELFMLDKKFGGEYYWTDINRMAQAELSRLGYDVKVDGDFGSDSCKALSSVIGSTKCGKSVSREQIEKLVALKGTLKLQ